MRRKLFSAVIVSALLAAASLGTASAADLLKAPATPAPWVCPWCGFYVGLNAGYGTTSGSGYNNTGTDGPAGGGLGTALVNGTIPITVDSNVSGFVGGGQIGYNWEMVRDWITGIEADFDGMGVKQTLTPAPSFMTPAGTNGAGSLMTVAFGREVDWFGTLRLKGGFSVMNNALFVYGTAGGAIAQFGVSDQFICGACTPNPAGQAGTNTSSKLTRVGGAIGAGVEWMVVPKLSVKAELLYIEVGNSTNTITYNYGGNASSLTSTARDGLTVFRGGLNWYF